MRSKKWLAMFMVIITLVITAACGNNTSNNTSQGDTKPDTVKVWAYPIHASYENDLKQIITEFNKQYPHIKVEYEILSYNEGPKKFDIALNAGDPPDLFFGGADAHLVNTGLAVSIDSYMTDEIKKDFLPGALETMKVGGKQYGLPLYQSMWGIGGNKRMLEEAGVDWKKIQEKGWTWGEFIDALKKLTKKLPDGSTQYGIVTSGSSTEFIDIVTRSRGLVDVVNEQGKFIWNDNRIQEAMELIYTLRNEGYMPKEVGALTPQKRSEIFDSGRAALMAKGLPAFDITYENRNKDIDAGKIKAEKIEYIQLPAPHHESVPGYGKMVGTGEGYMLFRQKNDKGEQHFKNAFLVLNALTGESAGNAANQLGLPYVRNSQAKVFEGKTLAKPHNIVAAQNMQKNLSPAVGLSIDPDTGLKVKQFKEQVMKPVYQALLAGEKTPAQAAEQFKAKGEQMFGQK